MVTLVSFRPSKELSEEDDYFDATFMNSAFEGGDSFSGNFISQIGMVKMALVTVTTLECLCSRLYVAQLKLFRVVVQAL